MADGSLRVALVGPLPPPAGGMANQTAQLARLLVQDGHAVTVVRTNSDYWPRWCGRIPMLRAGARLLPYLARLWRAMGTADLAHVMANSGWAWHLFAAPAIWIAWLRGVPVVVNYRGGEAEAFLQRAAAARLTLKRAAAVIVPSGFLQQVFSRHGMTAVVVPNIVDLSRFMPAQAAPERAGAPHLIVTRNLEAIYDVGTALRAFAVVREQWPQATLTVAGRGPQREALERLGEELGVASIVRFIGNVEPQIMAALYGSADLMLNASRVDNMPNAMLEAMASGVPIVSTDAGGIPFVVEHERTALLVAPGEPAAMAAAALRVLDDAQLARRLRRNGLEAVRQYTWDGVRPGLYAVYAACAGRRVVGESLP